MELKDFIKNFAAQLEDTEVSKIQGNTLFKELNEWSSLMALSIMAMIDEVYDVQINGEDIQKSKTIEDLYNIVKTRNNV